MLDDLILGFSLLSLFMTCCQLKRQPLSYYEAFSGLKASLIPDQVAEAIKPLLQLYCALLTTFLVMLFILFVLKERLMLAGAILIFELSKASVLERKARSLVVIILQGFVIANELI